ncbi:MAG: mechanosensitive ion channel [Afipia sp.]|nr:mechanosensitive ion channel [Afipia sp.]OJW60248.1 MAG: mechanosensitive ion channel protein MscS [Afipia sp. 64-13]
MNWNELLESLQMAARSVGAEVTSPWFYLQVGVILAASGIALAAASLLRARVNPAEMAMGWPAPLRLLLRLLIRHAGVAVFAALTALTRGALVHSTWPSRSYLLAVVASLATAWLIIRLATSLIRNGTVVRVVSVAAWSVAALSIIGQLGPVAEALDSVAITVGTLRLTPLLLIKATVFFAIALWLVNLAGNFLEMRITRANDLTPSVQVLLIKLIRVALFIVAIAVVAGSVGIDLSAFALFSGAIGVGLGFGLQKIIANFISGVILLADKSVKPGDLVTVGDSTGTISSMNTRYISVAAGDGREILIPNEDLVTQRVVNWTYTDRTMLVKVNFATNYDADPSLVCKLAIETARGTPNVAAFKEPGCLLTEFTEAGMKFALTFWVADIAVGMDAVRSRVMQGLWTAFKKEGIRVPYPVREIRVRGGALPVETVIEEVPGE